tara:strand:- start:652 stop:1476 length:825 start_codon:yes stop_codon:yes gene_type:complete
MAIKTRVLAQLGQDNTDFLDTITDLESVFTRAYWEALALMPPRMLIANIPEPLDPESMGAGDVAPGTVAVDDKRELLVFRVVANHAMNDDDTAVLAAGYINKPCKRISYENSKKSLDSDSIYFATDNSPVYWYQNVNGVSTIKTAPVTTGFDFDNDNPISGKMNNGKSGLQVFLLKRYTFTETDVGTTASALDSFPLCHPTSDNTDDWKDLPEEFEPFVLKKIAHVFIAEFLANAAVQEEDAELVQILGQQAQVLSEQLSNEVKEMKEAWGENE